MNDAKEFLSEREMQERGIASLGTLRNWRWRGIGPRWHKFTIPAQFGIGCATSNRGSIPVESASKMTELRRDSSRLVCTTGAFKGSHGKLGLMYAAPLRGQAENACRRSPSTRLRR